MTDLESKADSARPVVRANECEEQPFRLASRELTDAADIGDPEAFPEYGDFLDVEAVADGASLGPRWVECPGNLARALVDAGVEAGDVFTVEEAAKTPDGAWAFTVETDD